MRRSLVVRILGLILVVSSITFVACGPDAATEDGGTDGGRRDGGDNPPTSGVP